MRVELVGGCCDGMAAEVADDVEVLKIACPVPARPDPDWPYSSPQPPYEFGQLRYRRDAADRSVFRPDTE